jgi:hypothetical protein
MSGLEQLCESGTAVEDLEGLGLKRLQARTLVGALQKAVKSGRAKATVEELAVRSKEEMAEEARAEAEAARADLEAKRKIAEKAAKEDAKKAAVSFHLLAEDERHEFVGTVLPIRASRVSLSFLLSLDSRVCVPMLMIMASNLKAEERLKAKVEAAKIKAENTAAKEAEEANW